MCAVKEQRAGRGSEVKCIELKLHFTAVQPSLSLILLQRGFILLICPELRRQEAPTWLEEVEFMQLSVRLIIWYHLGLSAHLLRVKRSEISQRKSSDFTAHTDDQTQFLSLADSWRRWGSEAHVGFMQKLILVNSVAEIARKTGLFFLVLKRKMQWWLSEPVCCFWWVCPKQPFRPLLKRLKDGWLNLNLVLLPKTPNHCSFLFQQS